MHGLTNFAHGHSGINYLIRDGCASAAYFIFTKISGRSPLRARNTIEPVSGGRFAPAQPQWVSRAKLNLRRWNLPQANKLAAVATIARDINCCQSMFAR